MCIDIRDRSFGTANGQISSIFDGVICPKHARISFPDDNLSKYQLIFAKLGICINIVEIWFRTANGQISSIFDGVVYPRHARFFRFRTIT